MNEEEKKAIEFIKNLITWDVRQDLCPNKEECEKLETILNLIEKLQKENEELKKFITEGITVAPHSPYKNYRLDFLRENFVSKRRIKNEIAKMQEEYNKLDKKIELYLKKEEKTMQELYENRDNVGELQMIAYFIQTLQELLEESEEN